MPSLFADVVLFTPTLGGTTDWTFSAAVTGYQSPALAGIVNGATYSYRAESTDLTQWEVGTGTYNTSTGVLTRTNVIYNSSGTGTGAGQSGAGTKISFSAVPTVGLISLAEDMEALFVQDTAPASPRAGTLWWQSSTGNLYIYYNDGNSSQWVSANPAALPVAAVQYDVAQGLNSTQKAQARTNMGGFGAVKTRKFTSSGTYTPDANLLYAVIECVGGGGSGGGAAVTAVGTQNAAGSGGGGSYSRTTVTAATVGVSQTVTIGAGGAAPAAGFNNGNAGGDTSVGTLCIGKGGSGGIGCASSSNGGGGAGGAAGTGDFTVAGQAGAQGFPGTSNAIFWPTVGPGGTSGLAWGLGGPPQTASNTPNPGSLYGGGGTGGSDYNNTGNRSGGAGAQGICIITEYCSQ